MSVADTSKSDRPPANRQAPSKISLSIPTPAPRPTRMCLIVRIRVLVTAIVLASFSPVALATGHGQPDGGHGGHLAVSLFIGRRTRVAAAQQFDVNRPATTPARRHLQM